MTTTCEGCPYARLSGGKACGPRGDINADFVIIGEAPGAQEIVQGRPFIGPSGQLLDSALRRAGLAEGSEVAFVTNALRCRPPAGSPPDSAAVQSCRPRLVEEVLAGNRKVVLAMGNTAARSILNNPKLKITQERGKVFDTTFGQVVLSLHPAAILRNPGQSRFLYQDVAYAVSLLNGQARKTPGETKYTVVNEATAAKAVDALLKCETLSVDIETTGLRGPWRERVISAGVRWAPNRVIVFAESALTDLKRLFVIAKERGSPRFTWHNGQFDTLHLDILWQEPDLCRIDDDTILMHYCLNELRGTHDLKQLATDYLGAGDYEAPLKKWVKKRTDSFAKIPKPVLWKYQALDADYTGGVKDELWPEVLKQPGLDKLYRNLLIPATNMLKRMTRRGIWVNQDRLKEVDAEVSAEVEQSANEFRRLVGDLWDPEQFCIETGQKSLPDELNLNAPAQMKWVLYKQVGLKDLSKVGSTKEEFLKPHATDVKEGRQGHPVVDALMQHRKKAKEKDSYIDNVWEHLEDDGRIHATSMLYGTLTGRLAMRNPAMQTIPRSGPIKSIFQAPPGRVLIELDYSQAELRCLAFLSQDPWLMQCYQEGRKLHHEVAVEMFGDNYNAYEYIRAKAVNFGIPYGRGGASFAAEFKVSRAEGEAYVQRWFQRMPKAAAYLARCAAAPARGEVLVSPFSRRRRFGSVTRETLHMAQNEARNFPEQSAASDLTVLSAIKMEPDLFEMNSWLVNLVHDSVLIEADPAWAVQVIERASWWMAEVPRRYLKSNVPFETEAKVGTVWGQLKEVA